MCMATLYANKIKNKLWNKEFSVGGTTRPDCGFCPPDYVIEKIYKRGKSGCEYWVAKGYHTASQWGDDVFRYLGDADDVEILEQTKQE